MTEVELETPVDETDETDETDEDEPDEDEPDETEDEPDEPEASELLPAAQTEKEIEKRRGQLENEAARHTKRLTEILGEDSLGLIQCEACPTNTPGWHYPSADFPTGSPERQLYEMLAGGSGAEHKHPDYFQTCEECNGWGNVRTGAQMGLITFEIACPVCKTQGYIDTRSGQPAPAVAAAPVNGTTTAPEPEPVSAEDMWGRPPGHPHFGIFPIYLTAEQRAADLAAGFNLG